MSTTHGEGFFFLGFVPSRTEFPLPATGVNRWALRAPACPGKEQERTPLSHRTGDGASPGTPNTSRTSVG